MNRDSKIVLLLVAVFFATLAVTFGAHPSRASSETPDPRAEMPHALMHVKSVDDLFPRGR